MKNYIVSKKHKSMNYMGVSVVTATIALSTPMLLSADNTVLDEVNVSGIQEKVEYSDTYKVNKSSSSKITQDLVDTPQTVQVITEKILDEQKYTTLQEALRNTPGVTLQLGEGGNSNSKDDIQMRGFSTQSSLYKDGVRDVSNAIKDTFNTEAIEITKGAVGADNGRSVASGYINQVTKSAKNIDEIAGSIGYSTANNARLTADINKKIDETTGLRLNLMKQKGEIAGRDVVEEDHTGIAASLGFGIGTDTRTTINYEMVKQDDIPDGGVSTIGLDGYYNADLEGTGVVPSKVNSENFYGSTSDFEKSKSNAFSVKIEHDFSPSTTLSNITKYSKVEQEMIITAPNTITFTDINDSSTWTVARRIQQKWQESEIITNQTNLNSKLETGSFLHTISSGFDVTKEKINTRGYVNVGSMADANLYNPNASDAVADRDLTLDDDYDLKGQITTVGAYAFDNISITDNFMLVGGGRVDKYSLSTEGSTVSSSGTITEYDYKNDGTLFSWKLGAVYKPKENGSIYLSYASAQLPPAGDSLTLREDSSTTPRQQNPANDPEESETIELGTKWDLLNNKLAVTTSIYKTTVKNQVMIEDDGSYSQNGEKEVKGIELGLVGQITDKLSLSAGVAKMKTEITNSTNSGTRADEGASIRFSPEWSATLWSTYKFTPSFTIGVGARYMGEQFVSSRSSGQSSESTYAISEIEDYLVFDAMASYQIDKNSSVQLNIYNLTDEEYIANINNNSRRYTPGTPRTALLTYNFKF